MDLLMRIGLSASTDVEQAYAEYEKAKTKLIRALETERITAKEKTASAGTDTVE